MRSLRRIPAQRTICLVLASALALGGLTGCFANRSYPMVTERLVRVSPQQVAPQGQRLWTREWVETAHAAAACRLPDHGRDALTTEGLASHGHPVDVWGRFGLQAEGVDNVLTNYDGIDQTAAVASPAAVIEKGHVSRKAWAGFEDVEVPASGGAVLSGRLGTPEAGRAIPGSYVVITHGLFGTLDGDDMENHVEALRRAGHHVLALEMRGHGETQCRHPEYAITFGLQEAADLVAVDRWLRTAHGATRVGLMSFSLTGYEALLTTWLDGHQPVTELPRGPMFAGLPTPGDEPAYNGGVMVVSAPIGIIHLADSFEPRRWKLEAPVKATFQDHVAERLLAYHEPERYSMWDFAESELARAGYGGPRGLSRAELKRELSDFLDMSRDGWAEGVRRLDNVRVPMLVLSAANDPLGTGQGVADLFGRVKNPNVGVILLKEGGHMGFTALSADYYYSLIVNFFDPATAPAPYVEMHTAKATPEGEQPPVKRDN